VSVGSDARGLRSALPAMGLAVVIGLAAGCGRDAADQEYFAVLGGDETGMSESEMRARIDRAIALAPERAAYWQKRAGLRVGAGDLAGAEADLDRAIQLRDRPFLRFERGLVRARRGDFEAARDDLDAAIAAQPDNPQFYRGRALVLVALGEAPAARADADRLIEREPRHGESFYVRGRALALVGRHAEAVADYDEALRRRPDLYYVLRARAVSKIAPPLGMGMTARGFCRR